MVNNQQTINQIGGDLMDEQIRRLNQKLSKIKGNDAISRARKAALLKAIFELQNGVEA